MEKIQRKIEPESILLYQEAKNSHKDLDKHGHNRFSVLSLNVFPGSPLPFLFNGTRALFSTERLACQLATVNALSPDVICLQELYCTHSREEYIKWFGTDYHVLFEDRRNTVGVCIARVIVMLFALVLFLCVRVLLFPLWGFPSMHMEDTAIVFALCVVSFLSWNKTALFAWLAGDATGLTTLVRKSLGQVEEHQVTDFQVQDGDWMNVVAPRAYSTTRIRLFTDGYITVLNAHLNAHGTNNHRRAQAMELASASNQCALSSAVILCADMNANERSDEVALLLTQSSLTDGHAGVLDRCTWSARNPLTRGWMQAEDMCVDFVLFRSMADGHVLENTHVDLFLCDSSVVFTEAPFLSDHFGVLCQLSLYNRIYNQTKMQTPVGLFTRSHAIKKIESIQEDDDLLNR